MGVTGIIIKKLPRKKYTFNGKTRQETGSVVIKTGNGKKITIPVALLKASRGFNRLSLSEMKKIMNKPYNGLRIGTVVEISDERYWD